MSHEDALIWQATRAAEVARGAQAEIVVFVEHPAVYTQGRRGGREHVLRTLPTSVVDTDRGGDITFHGPGQLVVWPILRLRERGVGISDYVRALEEVAISSARQFGIGTERIRGRPGVWIENRKLASVGLRVQSGVSRHGMSLNCDVDLSWFEYIRACGVEGAEATSLTIESGRRIGIEECEPVARAAFAEVFDLRLSPVQLAGGAS